MEKYIKLQPRGKKPVEAWREPENQYEFQDLRPWLRNGGNVGFVCGSDDIVVLDIDNPELVEQLGIKPLYTFATRTGSGGFHLYYKSPGAQKVILFAHDGTHLGELQCDGQYVVTPPSIHPNGTRYITINQEPVLEASRDEILAPFEGHIKTQEPDWYEEVSRPLVYKDNPIDNIRVEDIWDAKVTRKSKEQIWCEHPVHGSTTGHNLIIHPGKNSWQCRRCMSGGGPALAIAVKYGVIDCRDAKKGALKGLKYLEVKAIAEEHGWIKPEKKLKKESSNTGGFTFD